HTRSYGDWSSDVCSSDLAAAGRRETEDECDSEILEQQDREHEVCFLVGQPAKVDQPFHGDRARRHVDGRREDERAEAEAEGCERSEERRVGKEGSLGGGA